MKTQVGAIIGTWERSWILAETDAPASYDVGSTIELYRESDHGRRTILVDDEDEEYQAGRYRSGLFHYETHDGDLRNWVQNRLVERLIKATVTEPPPAINWGKLDSEIARHMDEGYAPMARVARVVRALQDAGYQIRLGGQPPTSQKGGE